MMRGSRVLSSAHDRREDVMGVEMSRKKMVVAAAVGGAALVLGGITVAAAQNGGGPSLKTAEETTTTVDLTTLDTTVVVDPTTDPTVGDDLVPEVEDHESEHATTTTAQGTVPSTEVRHGDDDQGEDEMEDGDHHRGEVEDESDDDHGDRSGSPSTTEDRSGTDSGRD
jgi:hypothetical protein